MINSMMTICGHMTDRIMCNEKGAPLTLPSLLPSLYQFRLRFVDRDSSGKIFLTYPNVTSLLASIGLIYAEPRAGTFKLRYGSTGTPPETEAIDFTENPDDFRTKLAALAGSATYGLDVVYQPTPSTWMCRFLTPSPAGETSIPINGIENELEPETFIRTRQFVQNNDTWVEIRLMQGPVASTSAHDTVLPQPPTVREIRRGYTEGDALGLDTIIVNEIQAITVPPDFTGTYTIKIQGRLTIALSASSGASNIQDALNALWTDGQTRFTVTNPELNNAYVEFVGPFAGMPMDLLQIVISSPGPSDVTFNLDLFTTEVADALRKNVSVDAIFEVQLHITDPTVSNDPGQDLTLFQQTVTIERPLHWEGLEEAAPIDWLLPPNPKDYVPFDINQVIVGDLTYSTPFGDGIASTYVISHHLNSDALNVTVRENASSGRQLRDDEYTIQFTDANALTITILAGPPAVNSLLAVIFSSGPVSAFLNHTHTIGQIDGLQQVIDGILARLSALEALLPSVIGLIPGQSPFGSDPSSDIMDVPINNAWNIVPTNRPPQGTTFDPNTGVFPPAGFLLPAVHDVIELGLFTANPGTNTIVLSITPSPALVDGQRARIDTPQFSVVGPCTFDSSTDTITATAHGLIAGRRVQFSGATLPDGISASVIYYVINPTTNTFQVSLTSGGPVNPLLTNGDTNVHNVSVIPELPGGLSDAVDYFMLAPVTTTFQLSATIDGPAIDITSAGIGPLTISTLAEAPSIPTNGTATLPDPGPYAGDAFSVRKIIFLPASIGIPSETVNPGDIIASDGRIWYHVTRSDSPGCNSFYPNAMELELFTLAISDNLLAAGSVFTVTFELGLQMFKEDTNVQYLLVVEIADLPEVEVPPVTGPNLYGVEWNKKPLLQQRIIVTDVLMTHKFGAQVLRGADGSLATNKKLYGVEIAGDVIPSSANFAIRARLIEFDTEDNVNDGMGLIYYTLQKATASVSNKMPTPPTGPSAP